MIENPFKLEGAEDVAILLHAARKQRRLTLRQVAEQAHVSQAMVSLAESGKRVPHTPMLIHLLDSLGYDLQAVKR